MRWPAQTITEPLNPARILILVVRSEKSLSSELPHTLRALRLVLVSMAGVLELIAWSWEDWRGCAGNCDTCTSADTAEKWGIIHS